MKRIVSVMACLLVTTILASGSFLHKERVVVKVVDDGGSPVEGAVVDGYFDNPNTFDGMGATFKKTTDVNGTVRVKGTFYGFIEAQVKKKGYYMTTFKEWNIDDRKKASSNTLPVIKVELRRKKHPHPMYVRYMDEIVVPGTNAWYGFDFGVGDWVAPYGKGQTNDMQVKAYVKLTPIRYGFSYMHEILQFKFDAQELDGLIFEKAKSYSKFKSPYEAPLMGYDKMHKWEYERTYSKTLLDNSSRADDCIVFRCRSKVDKQGELKAANYGKIYGEINFGHAKAGKMWLCFRYYFNPEANDRNLEYDPEHNLYDGSAEKARGERWHHPWYAP